MIGGLTLRLVNPGNVQRDRVLSVNFDLRDKIGKKPMIPVHKCRQWSCIFLVINDLVICENVWRLFT